MKNLFFLIIALWVFYPSSAQNNSNNEALVVFLVRHAEKVDSSRDPELSEAGKQRAKVLAETLISAEIEYIHSTDYIRTRNTAVPTANAFNLDIEIYSAYDLTGFAEHLKSLGGRHLVVGHSNTTPKLVDLLGGDPGKPIVEKNEYDRLYIVTLGNKGSVNTVLLRYGEKYTAED